MATWNQYGENIFGDRSVREIVTAYSLRGNLTYQSGGVSKFNQHMQFIGATSSGGTDMFRPKMNVLGFDLETTGLEVGKSKVIQFSAVPLDKDLNPIGKSMELFSDPGKGHNWAFKARALAEQAGIGPKYLQKKGMSQDAMRKSIIDKMDILVAEHGKFQALGHNTRFDMEHLASLLDDGTGKGVGEKYMAKYFDSELLDTMALGAFAEGRSGGSATSFTLSKMAEKNGIKIGTAHNATFDVNATIDVYRKTMDTMGDKLGSAAINMKSAASAPRIVKVGKVMKGNAGLIAGAAVAGLAVMGMANQSEASVAPPSNNYGAPQPFIPPSIMAQHKTDWYSRTPPQYGGDDYYEDGKKMTYTSRGHRSMLNRSVSQSYIRHGVRSQHSRLFGAKMYGGTSPIGSRGSRNVTHV